MTTRVRTALKPALWIISFLFLSACATTLAPSYDQAIVNGLQSTSQKLMQFFASTTSGTTSGTARAAFDDRQVTYDNIIGSLDALVIQARARPIPKNSVTERVNAALEKRGVRVLDGDDAPSASAMQEISKTMVKMRDTDRKQGVTAFEVLAFRNQVEIYLDQAITYETYLER